MFFVEIEIREDLRAGALRGLELLIDRAHALERRVGLEQREDKGEEYAERHDAAMNLIAGDEDQHGDHDRAEQVHHRRSDDGGAHPAHVFAQQAARGFLELRDLERLHAEGFDDAIAGDGLLKDLAEFAEARLAVFGGAANLAAELADGKHDQRQENDRAQRHAPVERERRRR